MTIEKTGKVIHVDFGMDPILNKGDFVKLKENGSHGIVIEVKSRFESGSFEGQALFVDVAVPMLTDGEEGEWKILNDVYLEDLVRVIAKYPEPFDDLEELPFQDSDFNFEEHDHDRL